MTMTGKMQRKVFFVIGVAVYLALAAGVIFVVLKAAEVI